LLAKEAAIAVGMLRLLLLFLLVLLILPLLVAAAGTKQP
jgi:hypothetical protein